MVPGRESRGADSAVAGGGHEDASLGPGVINGVLEMLAEIGIAEGHEDDVGAVIGSPDDPLDDVAVLSVAAGIQDGHRHEPYSAVGDAGYPLAVAGHCRDDSGHLGAVAGGVGEPGGTVQDGGSGDHVTLQIRVGSVNTGVQQGHGSAPGGDGRAVDLVPADLRQSPLDPCLGVVGERLSLPRLVHLHALHVRIGLIVFERQGEHGGRDRDDMQSQGRHRRLLHPTVPGDNGGLLCGCQSLDQFDHNGCGRRLVRSVSQGTVDDNDEQDAHQSQQ